MEICKSGQGRGHSAVDGGAVGGVAFDPARVRSAAIRLAAFGTAEKNAALARAAACLLAHKAEIEAANALDLARAGREALPMPLQKRLKMDGKKIEDVVAGIQSLISLPDPAGRELFAKELSEGLVLRKLSCPIGVVGVIFESRPDALVQIASLCLKSGNAVVLKGGSEARETNRVLSELILTATVGTGGADTVAGNGDAAEAAAGNTGPSLDGAPEGWLCQLEKRSEIDELLRMDDAIDLLIPRGSNEFVRYIMEHTRIPVMGHADGLCHCYVDASAELSRAVRVVVDAKTQYAAVCNATETLLVHEAVAPAFLPALWDALNSADGAQNDADGTPDSAGNAAPGPGRVVFRGCARTREILGRDRVEAATEQDWRTEYLDYILAVKVVGGVDEAIAHINQYGSRHTDAILAEDAAVVQKFTLLVDSANVFHNCSTRFSDGFRYGFGAEVGVSTGKFHARGPVGLEGLVTYKYVLSGHGDVVADFEEGRKRFTFKPLPT
ncbi:MAG: glutamate-5-semialdehyde dehydrogenase [Clostridiales bacterium]|nr:glutamate-5-semialdehyde dehydrogenase [Clostridiales bacterium]